MPTRRLIPPLLLIGSWLVACDRSPAPAPAAAGSQGAAGVPPSAVNPADLDLSGAVVPDGPISGQIAGARFEVSAVEFHAHSDAIVLRSATGQVIFLFVPGLDLDALPPDGFAIEIIRPRAGADQPHVHLHHPDPAGGDVLEQRMFTEGFTLRLRVTPVEKGDPAIGIVLRLPTQPVSSIAGRTG